MKTNVLRWPVYPLICLMLAPGCGTTVPVNVDPETDGAELKGVTIVLKSGERIVTKHAVVKLDVVVIDVVRDHRKDVELNPPRVVARNEIATITRTSANAAEFVVGAALVVAVLAVATVVVWAATGAPLD